MVARRYTHLYAKIKFGTGGARKMIPEPYKKSEKLFGKILKIREGMLFIYGRSIIQ
jgi:hypothetical protein